MARATISIALAEDSVSDAALLRLALVHTGAHVTLVHFLNGRDLLIHLGVENGERADSPPTVVLLDLNLPGMTGFDVLARIRSADHLSETPVIVLSGSSDSEDADRCYGLGANLFLSKPCDLDEVFEIARQIVAYVATPAARPIASDASGR